MAEAKLGSISTPATQTGTTSPKSTTGPYILEACVRICMAALGKEGEVDHKPGRGGVAKKTHQTKKTTESHFNSFWTTPWKFRSFG